MNFPSPIIGQVCHLTTVYAVNCVGFILGIILMFMANCKHLKFATNTTNPVTKTNLISIRENTLLFILLTSTVVFSIVSHHQFWQCDEDFNRHYHWFALACTVVHMFKSDKQSSIFFFCQVFIILWAPIGQICPNRTERDGIFLPRETKV